MEGAFAARLLAEERCLCVQACNKDRVLETRQAGQTQPTEGAEKVATSASKHRPGIQLTWAARGRGSGMLIPQQISSGVPHGNQSHSDFFPLQTRPHSPCTCTHVQILTNHVHTRVLSPTYLHTRRRAHLTHRSALRCTQPSADRCRHLRSRTPAQDHTLGPVDLHTHGALTMSNAAIAPTAYI